MPLEILDVHFDCAGLQNLVGWRGCSSRLRSRCGAVRMVVTLDGRHTGNLVFGGPKSTFRDRCKGSERFYFDV